MERISDGGYGRYGHMSCLSSKLYITRILTTNVIVSHVVEKRISLSFIINKKLLIYRSSRFILTYIYAAVMALWR